MPLIGQFMSDATVPAYSNCGGLRMNRVICCQQPFWKLLVINQTSVVTGTFLMLNNAVSQDQRGAANGLAMTGMSLFKTLGPAGGGSLFAWAQKRQHASFLPGDHMVFFILSFILAIVFVMTFEPFLPQSTNRSQREDQNESNPEEQEQRKEQEPSFSS